MKLNLHPASTTSRPPMMVAAEQGLALDMEIVDLFTGEHLGEACATVNPCCLVPTLQDGGSRLTESAAILKCLADKVGSPLCPTNLQARARVNERMDWINTQLCRDRTHVRQWLARMKARPTKAPVYCAIDSFAAQLPRDAFVAQ